MLAAEVTRLGFVTWDRDDPTGGNVYNRALVAELRALGINVRLHKLAGPWPEGDASSHAKLARALRAEPGLLGRRDCGKWLAGGCGGGGRGGAHGHHRGPPADQR